MPTFTVAFFDSGRIEPTYRVTVRAVDVQAVRNSVTTLLRSHWRRTAHPCRLDRWTIVGPQPPRPLVRILQAGDIVNGVAAPPAPRHHRMADNDPPRDR